MHGQQLKFDLDGHMMRRHVKAVHDGDDGYIALCSISGEGDYSQRHYLYDELMQTLKCTDIDESYNYYVSVNSFFIPKRLLENVRQIRALYADIDCHHLNAWQAARVIEDTINYLELPSVKKQIPAPSIYVPTGRGLQLYWLLEDLPKQAVPLWKMVQDAITDKLKEVISELDVTIDNISDIARILRLPGTVNTKADKMATLVINSPDRYRLDALISDFFPELGTIPEPKKNKAAQGTEAARISHIYNLYSLHFARINDLVKLLEIRKGDADGDECRRRMVFLYRYWGCCYLQDAPRAREEALMFNEGFTYPLPRKTVIRETESAEKAYFKWLSGETVSINGQAYRKGYNYKNATLIRWLDITPDEQRELSTIIGKEEKYKRKNIKRTGRDENGLTAKQRALKTQAQRAKQLKEQGQTQRVIADKLGISQSKVCRLLNS